MKKKNRYCDLHLLREMPKLVNYTDLSICLIR